MTKLQNSNHQPQIHMESQTLEAQPEPALLSGSNGRPWLRHYASQLGSRLQVPKLTLPEMLEKTAKKFPRRTALIYFDTHITYARLLEHVQRCAAGLQALGLRKGDRVGLMLSNCPVPVLILTLPSRVAPSSKVTLLK